MKNTIVNTIDRIHAPNREKRFQLLPERVRRRNWALRTHSVMAASVLVLALASEPKGADLPVLTNGHLDIGINYASNAWDLHVHAEDAGVEYAPDAAWIQIPGTAIAAVPADEAYRFLGTPGRAIWMLAAVQIQDRPFLGIGTEEMGAGIFANNTIQLALRSVEGPGSFIAYQTDMFGKPVVWFNSSDGFDLSDVRPIAAGGHAHVNWVFTAPGKYRVGFQASGVLASSGQTVSSEIREYLFDVSGTMPAACVQFTEEHVDLLSLGWNDAGGELSLKASDDTHGGKLYDASQCVVICPEAMKFSIPAGTPLGREGDPLWIFPQNPYAGTPYLGVSAEQLNAGVFEDPLSIRLLRAEGPGDFIAWQSSSFGVADIKMDTRDGIGPDDVLRPVTGGHEHYNWGFTASGVYRLTFQASGRLVGQTTNVMSAEAQYTFRVLPLAPFENWQISHWPCEGNTNIISAIADPDGDGMPNLMEYAFGTDPSIVSPRVVPSIHLESTNGAGYGSISFRKSKEASDCVCEVLASDAVQGGGWEVLSGGQEILDLGDVEQVTVRDSMALNGERQRFYKLRVRLK